MKVLAFWVDPSSPNYGVRALAEGLRNVLPVTAEVTFVSHNRPLQSGRLNLKNMVMAAIGIKRDFILEIESYDYIVDVGEGDSFASIYGWKRFGKLCASKIATGRFGKSLILAPQTLGPWEGYVSKFVAKYAMRSATTVWARDSLSAKRASAVGQASRLGTDLAFAVPQPRDVDPDAPEILINVSGLLWHENRHVDFLRYRSLITSIIEDCISSGRTVGLLAHVIAPGQHDDDSDVVNELSETFPSVSAIVPDSLERMRSVIAGSSLVVGSRMHACLNALSMGIPTLPLAYSDKFQTLFNDLDYEFVYDLRELKSTFRLEPEDMRDDPARRAMAGKAKELAQQRIADFRDSLVTPRKSI